jgi:hypothetical protein
MTEEVMVTVIATGFSKQAAKQSTDRFAATASKPRSVVDHIPNGVRDLQKLDTPTYLRRGIAVNAPATQEENKVHSIEQSKSDLDRPAFLRRIMD